MVSGPAVLEVVPDGPPPGCPLGIPLVECLAGEVRRGVFEHFWKPWWKERPDMEEELLLDASADSDGFRCFQFLGVVVMTTFIPCLWVFATTPHLGTPFGGTEDDLRTTTDVTSVAWIRWVSRGFSQGGWRPSGGASEDGFLLWEQGRLRARLARRREHDHIAVGDPPFGVAHARQERHMRVPSWRDRKVSLVAAVGDTVPVPVLHCPLVRGYCHVIASAVCVGLVEDRVTPSCSPVGGIQKPPRPTAQGRSGAVGPMVLAPRSSHRSGRLRA